MKKFLLCTLALIMFFISSQAAFAQVVIFNTKTLKFHKPSCSWAQKCTTNCIKIEKKEAIKRGGIPCKVCGG